MFALRSDVPSPKRNRTSIEISFELAVRFSRRVVFEIGIKRAGDSVAARCAMVCLVYCVQHGQGSRDCEK
jgi:hypothetical protein